jgi:hypothetical protein
MLGWVDRQFLQRWCRGRRMKWFAIASVDGQAAVLLVAEAGDRPPIRVVADRGELRLETASGHLLAMSSNLAALLDVVDAGIADLPLPSAQPGACALRQVA